MINERLDKIAKQKLKFFYNDTHDEVELTIFDNGVPEDNIGAIWKGLYENEEIDPTQLATMLYKESLINFPDVRQRGNLQVSDAELIKIDNTHTYYPHRLSDNGELFVAMYIVPYWNKEWGGETIIFTECEATDAVSCIPARVLFSSSNNWMRIAQPTEEAKIPMWMLQFKLV